MKILSWLFAVFLLIFAAEVRLHAQTTDSDAIWNAMESGDTAAAFWQLAEIYERSGTDAIARNKGGSLGLKLQEPFEIINRYSNGSVEISLSRMVKISEARQYWQNWSDVLAAGNFDHKNFFRNDEERRLLANFNVVVLASHELGHYLDYNYKMSDRDFSGGFLHDNDPLNCTEAYADKFAVSMLNTLAADPRFAALRKRYVELITEFNRSIPAENRYDFTTPDLAIGRCGEIDLLKNGVEEDGYTVNQNFFRQYTSAYFNRHLIFLKDPDFADIGRTAKRDLIDPYFKRLDMVNRPFRLSAIRSFAASGLRDDMFYSGKLTEKQLEFDSEMRKYDFATILEDQPVSIKGIALFATGDLLQTTVSWTAKRKQRDGENVFSEDAFDLKTADADGKTLFDERIELPSDERGHHIFGRILLIGRNEMILPMIPVDLDVKHHFAHMLLVRFKRSSKGGWTHRFQRFQLPDSPSVEEFGGNWSVFKDKLFVHRVVHDPDEKAVTVTKYEIDRKDLSARQSGTAIRSLNPVNSSTNSMKNGLWRTFHWGSEVFSTPKGEIFVMGLEQSLVVNANIGLFRVSGRPQLFIGTFDGIVDGSDPRTAKIQTFTTARFTDKNTIIFAELLADRVIIRKLELL